MELQNSELPSYTAFTSLCAALDKEAGRIHIFYGNIKAEYSMKRDRWRVTSTDLHRYYYCFGDESVWTSDAWSVYMWEYQDYRLIRTDARTTEIIEIRKSPYKAKLDHPVMCRNYENEDDPIIFMLGGRDVEPRGRVVMAYNTLADVYYELPSMVKNIAGYATCVIDDETQFMYVMGGFDEFNQPSDSIQRFKIDDLRRITPNRWQLLPVKLPYTLLRSASVIVNGWVTILGGWAPSKDMVDPYSDTAKHVQDVWSFSVWDNEDFLHTEGVLPSNHRVSSLAVGREQHVAFIHQQRIWVVGGQTADDDAVATWEKSDADFPFNPECPHPMCSSTTCRQLGVSSLCRPGDIAVYMHTNVTCPDEICPTVECGDCGRRRKCKRECKKRIERTRLEDLVDCDERCALVSGFRCFVGCPLTEFL